MPGGMIAPARVMSAPRGITARPANPRECSESRPNGRENSPPTERRRRKPQADEQAHDEVCPQEHEEGPFLSTAGYCIHSKFDVRSTMFKVHSRVRRGSPDPAENPTAGLPRVARPPVITCGSDHHHTRRCPRPATTEERPQQNVEHRTFSVERRIHYSSSSSFPSVDPYGLNSLSAHRAFSNPHA
jgi:hypothetical protein